VLFASVDAKGVLFCQQKSEGREHS
jgi:hypothetical protein